MDEVAASLLFCMVQTATHSHLWPAAEWTRVAASLLFCMVQTATPPHTPTYGQLLNGRGGGQFALLHGADGHPATQVQAHHLGLHLVPRLEALPNKSWGKFFFFNTEYLI